MDLNCFYDLLMFFRDMDEDVASVHYQAIPLDYDEDMILKSCIEMHDAGLINAYEERYIDGNIDFYYKYLTDEGKDLIDRISDSDKWDQLKKQADGVNVSGLVIKMLAYNL